MKFYFLSCAPAELTVNNVFFGIVDSFERCADVELSDRVFARFTPQNALPVGLFLDDTLLSAPPHFCDVYLLKDGVAVYIKAFPPLDHTLRPIAQARQGELLVSVFKQGDVQLSLQSPSGFFVSTLPPSFETCALSFHADLVFVEGEERLIIYTKDGKRVFCEHILDFSVDGNTLNATLPLSDSLQRTAEGEWKLSEQGVEQTRFTLRQARGNAPEELLAYAFFESLLLGCDPVPLLSDELKGQAEGLVGFLGEFEGVVLTDSPYTCGLVRRKASNLFEVTYATVNVNLGKITEITC